MDHWTLAAGMLALSSVTLSLYEVSMHMRNFTKPYLQRYIIRILLMVPIYSLNAWFAMLVPASGLYLDSLREVYESFVIYSFMKYLMNFLNYDTNLQQYIDYKPGPRHIPPLCCLPSCIGGRAFLLRCKHGIIQYVIVRPITTFVAFISQELGFYGEGNYNPLSGFTFPVLLLLNNASQITSMYCLVIFYTSYRQELEPMRPLAKFFSIKLVVFFSFFQSVVVAGLLEINAVRDYFELFFPTIHNKVSLGRRIQELLICLDMLLAAIGHVYAFTYKPFTEPDASDWHRSLTSSGSVGRWTQSSGGTSEQRHRPAGGGYHNDGHDDDDSPASGPGRNCCGALCSILDFSEDKNDFSEHFGQIYGKMIQMLSFRRARLPSIVVQESGPGPAASRNGRKHSNKPIQTRRLDDGWLVRELQSNQTGIDNQPARASSSTAAINIRSYQSI